MALLRDSQLNFEQNFQHDQFDDNDADDTVHERQKWGRTNTNTQRERERKR